MTKSTAERQRAYKARKQEQGLVRVSAWVHKDDAEEILAHAACLCYFRKKHGAEEMYDEMDKYIDRIVEKKHAQLARSAD